MEDIAVYLAQAIKEGRMGYTSVLNNPKLSDYKQCIDELLTVDGRQDLIKKVRKPRKSNSNN